MAEEINYTKVKENLDSLGTKVAGLAKNRDKWKASSDDYKKKYDLEAAGRSSDLEKINTKVTAVDTKVNNINNKIPIGFRYSSIILDSFVLDGTTLTNVEFENVGNGIFLSKNILKGISMDNLLKIGGAIQSNKGVGECDIGKAAATSIEASLRRQFGNSVSLKTYVRTYDGATHSEKVFLPLECEVHGKIQYSADKDTLGKYQQWSIPNKNVKTGINGWWWCANKSSTYGYSCLVNYNGDPSNYYSRDGSGGVALAFYL